MKKTEHINYENTDILITGGSGFIGRKLAERLAALGGNVHAMDLQPGINAATGVVFHKADITDPFKVAKTVAEINPEMIVHLAASLDRKWDIDTIHRSLDVNVGGLMNLFSALVKTGSARSVIVSGTAEEYGNNKTPFREDMRENPVSAYSFSKASATHLCQFITDVYDLPVTVLRPTIAYGPGQQGNMFLPSLITRLLQGKKFEMTLGEQTRDFLYIDDLIEAYVLAGLKQRSGIYNIGAGKAYRIRYIAEKVGEMLDRRNLLSFGAIEYRKSEVMDYVVDCSKAKEELGWKPKTGIDEGLRRTIDSF
jgi:UDP-glucose 4-epimerase